MWNERGSQGGDGAEDLRLFGNPPLCSSSPGQSGFVPYHLLGEREFLHKHGIDLKEVVLRLQSRFWQQSECTPGAVQLEEVG